jgi:hypothetical protein
VANQSQFTKGTNMEATLQPSLQHNVRSRLAALEALELALLGFGLWGLLGLLSPKTPDFSSLDLMVFLIFTEGILLGSWLIYNAYIRIARAGGTRVDIALWVIASALSGSYTFWAWTILDINRIIIARLFYQGDAPVEYAWSIRSKKIRKLWEQARKAGLA